MDAWHEFRDVVSANMVQHDLPRRVPSS